MYTFVHSSVSQIQNYAVSLNEFSGTTKKYAKIISVALAVLIALAAFISVYRRYQAKPLASDQTPVPPSHNQNSMVVEEKEQREEILKKTQEIARLPISPDSDGSINLVRYSETMIKEKKGILLTKNYCQIPHVYYLGIVALPVEGGYCLHLSPGPANMYFNQDQINNYMAEAIKELVKQNIRITEITGNIGGHAGDTLENFKKWQSEHSV